MRKHTTRRRPILTLLAMSALLILLGVLLTSCEILQSFGSSKESSGSVPVYTGMTVSAVPDDTQSTLEAQGTRNYGEPGSSNGQHKGQYKGDCKGEQEPTPPEEPFETPLEDTLSVEGPLEKRYYAKPDGDIYVTVHIDNPDSYEILSFTLNGEKFSSYMFEDGSDMENLILKVNVGAVEGIVEYTIDAIKYVDGNQINDAKMDGDRTVEVGVYTKNQPTSSIFNEQIGFTSLSLGITAKDGMGLVEDSNGHLRAVVYDGEEIVAEKEISITGASEAHFEGLLSNKLYQYAVLGTYDALDGTGINTYVLYKKSFYTKPIVLFDNVSLSTTGVTFSLAFDRSAPTKALTALTLYKDGEKLRELSRSATAVDGLIPNTAYKLVASYQVGENPEQITLEFTTDALFCTVTHLLEDLSGKSYELMESEMIPVIPGETFSPATKSYKGFTAPKREKIEITADAEDFTVEYKYTRTVYTLTFNDGRTTSTEQLKYGEGITRKATREDFEFLGWYNEKGNKITTMPSANTVVYASFAGEATEDDLIFTVASGKVTITGLKNRTITKLYIPAHLGGKPVAFISARAFLDETQLTEVMIPSSVTSIGAGAFSGCAALQKISIPFVGGGVKSKTDTYQYPFGYIFGTEKYDGGVDIKQIFYQGSTTSTTSTSYYIPESLTSVTVTGGNILRGAFYGCKMLTEINLPANCTEINPHAFSLCSGLESIVLPDSIIAIDFNAFSECAKLHEINLPASLKTLGTRAFMGCAIESILLPSGLTTVEEGAFFRCSKLTSITVAGGNTALRMESGCLIDVANRILLTATPGATIPDNNTVKIIGDGAFSAADWLTEITIPANIEALNRYAFFRCVNLHTLQFASHVGLREIGSSAFQECAKLSEVIVPTSVTKMGAGVFASCEALKALSIPFVGERAVTATDTYQYPFGYIFGSLASGATAPTGYVKVYQPYYGQDLKTTVQGYYAIPEGLTDITITGGTYLPPFCLQNCSMLQHLTLPESLEVVERYALRGCSKLIAVRFPESVTTMGIGVLSGCSVISELTIPFVGKTATPTAASSTTVFGYIFGSTSFTGANKCNQYYSTSQYTTVYLPESLKALTVLGGKLMYGALNGCTKLVEVTLGDNVTYVGQTAFKTCVHLTKISLGTDITYIGQNAFQDCNMLTEVHFNSKKLGSFGTTTAPFQGLNVQSVLVGEAVERIPGYMFYNCTALENVIFAGDSACTEIMSYAFRQCTALQEITLPESLVTLNRYAFYNCTNLATLTLNSSNLPDYTSTTAPFRYTSIKTLNIGSNVQRIPAYMLYYCTTLETVNFMDGSSCTEIGNFAFRNCKALKQIKLPAGLKTVGEAAFLSCTALTAIELPDTLTALGANCFNSCTSLKTVYYTGTSTQWQIVENIAVIPTTATVYYVSKMPD